MSNQYLSFDVTKQSAPQQLIIGREGDSQLKFVSILFWDGEKNVPYDLTGKQIVFEALKPDGTHIIDSAGVSILNATGGLARYAFNEQVFTSIGAMQQAFFKITQTDSNNNVITDSTLEISIKVLENKVEFGINSTDYLSEYDRLVSAVKKKFDDYAATVQDSIDKAQKIHDQIVEYTNLINSSTIDQEDTALIGGAVFDEDLLNLNQIRSKLDKSKFNLVFITDVHYGKWSVAPEKLNNFTIQHLNNALYLDGFVDTIVFGGDNIDGWTRNKQEILNENLEFSRKALFGSKNVSDKFILKGNHDDASGNIYQYKNGDFAYLNWLDGNLGYSSAVPKIITDDELKEAYKTEEKMFGESRNGDSLYFYKDYEDKKIRLIGLNSNDTPTILDTSGMPKFIGLTNVGFKQNQVDWLANTALKNIPENYDVLIVSHVPATSIGPDSHNQDLVNKILNAFISGEDGNVQNTDPDWGVNVSYNFSQQGPRNMIGYINGHLHQEFLEKTPGFNSISILSSINASADGVTSGSPVNTDGWSVISVDKNSRKVDIIGFGRATNRTTSY